MHDVVADLHERQRNVGCQFAVAGPGGILASGNLGLADLEHHVPVRRDTRFAIASVTKAFTGAALLRLVEREAIDLDAPIPEYVPSFGDPRITPRLLAGHLGGVRHYRPGEKSPQFLSTHYDDIADAIDLFGRDPLVAEPGTIEAYSSYGYNLLAAAIQAAAARPFAECVAREVLEPLGLRHTVFDDVRRPCPGRARPYSWYAPTSGGEIDELWRVPDWDYSYNLGGGNLLSTAEDLGRFGAAFLTPGYLGSEALDLTRSPVATPRCTSAWSIGWIVDETPAGALLQAGGAFTGWQAALTVAPGDQTAVAVVVNTWGIGSASAEVTDVLPRRMLASWLGVAEDRYRPPDREMISEQAADTMTRP